MTPPVAIVEGWTLTRMYDGAPLAAERLPDRGADDVSIEVDKDGCLEIVVGYRSSGYGGSCSHSIWLPHAAAVALLRDALARGVLTLAELTEERKP